MPFVVIAQSMANSRLLSTPKAIPYSHQIIAEVLIHQVLIRTLALYDLEEMEANNHHVHRHTAFTKIHFPQSGQCTNLFISNQAEK